MVPAAPRQICKAALPTPLAAAWMMTTSWAFRPARRTRFSQAVRKASGMAAASSKESPSGMGIACPCGTRAFSA
jgi:hypothetical protein